MHICEEQWVFFKQHLQDVVGNNNAASLSTRLTALC